MNKFESACSAADSDASSNDYCKPKKAKPAMIQRALGQFLEELEVFEWDRQGVLQVFGVRGPSNSCLEYLTMDEAFRANTLHVAESGGSGTVEEVTVENRGTKKVLLLAGELLLGAKQNRVVVASTMIAPMHSLRLPVCCVERGRWEPCEHCFDGSSHFAPSGLRSLLTLGRSADMLQRADARSLQIEVWREVRNKLHDTGSCSPTDSLSAIYDDCEEGLTSAIAGATAPDDSLGVSFALDGSPQGIDVFDQATTLEKLYRKLFEAYGIDALQVTKATRTITAGQLSAWLHSAKSADISGHPSRGVGTTVRIEGNDSCGGCLVVQDQPVHFALFPKHP